MTLGALGGAVKPFTRAEIRKLAETSPVIGTTMAARAFGVTEPVIREMARSGDLEKMGVRVLRLGRLLRYPVADILQVLGIDLETETAGSAPPDPAALTSLRPLSKGPHDHGTAGSAA